MIKKTLFYCNFQKIVRWNTIYFISKTIIWSHFLVTEIKTVWTPITGTITILKSICQAQIFITLILLLSKYFRTEIPKLLKFAMAFPPKFWPLYEYWKGLPKATLGTVPIDDEGQICPGLLAVFDPHHWLCRRAWKCFTSNKIFLFKYISGTKSLFQVQRRTFRPICVHSWWPTGQRIFWTLWSRSISL